MEDQNTGTNQSTIEKAELNKNLPNRMESWFHLKESDMIYQSPRYLIIKHKTEGMDFNKFSPFIIEKWLSQFSKEIKAHKLRREGTLLIQSPNSHVSEKILKAKEMYNQPISVTAHKTKNHSRGVFSCKDIEHLPNEEILNELKNQGAFSIRRIQTKSTLFDCKFSTQDIPEKIRIGYMQVKVRPYIPKPLICRKCQNLGHSEFWCKKKPVCAFCAKDIHEDYARS